jgi:preprotein translocase subunit SecG
MQTVLITFHLIVVVALGGVVLVQRSEGGALGIGGGGFMTGRGQANALTRATAILGTMFFITSLALTVMANMGRAPKSIFQGVAPPSQSAPAGNVLDQLKQIEERQPSAPAAPVAPAAPAAPEPPRQ